MWCWHSWEVVEKQVFPTRLEQMGEAGIIPHFALPEYFNRDVVIHYRCRECKSEKVVRI